MAGVTALRSGLTLLGGAGAGFVLRLARNILVARLISVEDYGIASTFLVAVTFIDMALNLSLNNLAIQSRSGENPEFIAALKGISILRGVAIFVILYLGAAPIAAVLGQPDLVWAYQAIALLPLIGAFAHPDLQRLQRSMRFGPLILNKLGTLGLTLALVWPLALVFGDYRVMLAIYLIEAVVRLGLSFGIAERPYRIGWRRDVAIQALIFAWPLTLAGLITFAAIQGDRVIIANRFGAEMLGLFSAAMTLAMPPIMQAAELMRTFFLPLLARFQDDAAAFAYRTIFTLQAGLCAAALTILGFALTGPPVFLLVFGPRYADGAGFVGLLGIVFGLQLARSGTTTVAMALGHTANMLVANLVRLAFLPVAFLAAMQGGSAMDVVAIGALGQLFGVVASVLMLHFRSRVGEMRQMALPMAFGLTLLAAVSWGLWDSGGGLFRPVPAIAAVAAFALTVASCRSMLRELLRVVRRRPRPES